MAVSGPAARRVNQANPANRGTSNLAQLAAQAAAQGSSPMQALTNLAESVANRARANARQPGFQLPAASRDPAAPRYGNPAAAPGYQDQAYTSPNLRYSEQQLGASVDQLFRRSREASRAAAQDQAYVEGNRLQNQRAIQGDALASNERVQMGGFNASRRSQQSGLVNALTALQFQQGAAQAMNSAAGFTGRSPIGGQRTLDRFGSTMTVPAAAGGGRSGTGTDPAAVAQAALTAQLANRERMQQADLAAGDRRQAAQLQYQREAPSIQAGAEDELRRKAAMRALEVFRQGQGPRQRAVGLSNQGRVY